MEINPFLSKFPNYNNSKTDCDEIQINNTINLPELTEKKELVTIPEPKNSENKFFVYGKNSKQNKITKEKRLLSAGKKPNFTTSDNKFSAKILKTREKSSNDRYAITYVNFENTTENFIHKKDVKTNCFGSNYNHDLNLNTNNNSNIILHANNFSSLNVNNVNLKIQNNCKDLKNRTLTIEKKSIKKDCDYSSTFYQVNRGRSKDKEFENYNSNRNKTVKNFHSNSSNNNVFSVKNNSG